MKNFRIFLVIFLFAVVVAGLVGEDFQLVYLEGNAELRTNGKWEPLNTGDTVEAKSSIRLSARAIAEFAGPGDTLLFSSPGSYILQASARGHPRGKKTAVSSIFSRLSKVRGTGEHGKSEVMGVRGSEAVEEESFTWVDEDSLNFKEARKSFENGEYQKSLDILTNKVDPIVLDDPGAYWYYLAASYNSLGKRGRALGILANHEVESFSSVHKDYLFLKGQLAVESLNYQAAAEAFQAYINNESNQQRQQFAYYLLGVSHSELGNNTKGVRALEKAVDIGADREITELARMHLNENTP